MWRRLRALVSGRRLDRELDAELRFHIDMEAEKYVSQRLPPDEARSLAWRNFVVKHTEEARDQRGVGVAEALVQDSAAGNYDGFTIGDRGTVPARRAARVSRIEAVRGS